jgi:hypothetical protein
VKGLNGFSTATLEFTADMDAAFDGFNQGVDNTQTKIDEYVQKVFDADEKVVKSAKKAGEGRGKALDKALDKAAKDAAKTPAVIPVKAEIIEITATDKAISAISSAFLGGLAAGGRGGAQQAIAGGAGALGTLAFGSEIGAGIQQAVQFLGQDPEAFKGAITGFVEGIPQVIDAIVANIPTLVIALAENAGAIITALLAATPQIIVALANAMPDVARALLNSLVQGIEYQFQKLRDFFSGLAPGFQKFAESIEAAGKLGQVITDAGKNFFDAIIQAGKDFANSVKPGGSSGGFIKQLSSNPSGAIGGAITGGIEETQKIFGANLAGSPAFIPQTSAQVASSGDSGGITVGLLNQILAAVSAPTQASAKVDFNGKVLADIILDLNKRNARLTA